MPRDGSGVASAPAGTKATAGTTIQSAPYNAWVDDIIAEMNSARPIVAGGTGANTAVGAFDKLNTKGTNVASATTVNLTTATGARVNVTGTTTTSAITLTDGAVRIVRAVAEWPLTASSSLIINGSEEEDYTAVADDLFLVEGYSGGVVRVWLISPSAVSSLDAAVADLQANQDFLSIVASDLYGNFLGMARGWSDAFDTEDGIDTGASSGFSYSAADDLYEPAFTLDTDYTNTGGTGDRTAIITASATIVFSAGSTANLINGTNDNVAFWNNGQSVAGLYVRFDFATSKVVTEAKWYQSGATAQGTWKWQGSNNATDWTDIGSSFTLGGATTQTQTQLSANTTAYRYYQLLGVSGTSSSSPFVQEIEFKIGDAGVTENGTLVSEEFAAPASVGETAAFLDLEFGSALDAGTDFDFAMTSAASPSYTSTGATYTLWYSSGDVKRYLVEGIDLSTQADDAVRARFRTLTNKAIKITGWRPRWSDA